MSEALQERPKETIDPGIEAAEPKFDNCWVDCEREIIKAERAGITFRMRSVTIGEERRICDELNERWKVKASPDDPSKLMMDIGDEMTIVVADDKAKKILTVCAALGAWHKYSTEGWSDSREVTQVNVEALKGDVLDWLYSEYVTYFRRF